MMQDQPATGGSPPTTRTLPMQRELKQLKAELKQANWEAAARTLRDILKSKKCNGYVFSAKEGKLVLTAFRDLFMQWEPQQAFNWYQTCWPSLKVLLATAEFAALLTNWFDELFAWGERLRCTENGHEKALDLYEQLLSWTREQKLSEQEVNLLFAKGYCYMQKREFTQAAVYYELAHALSTTDVSLAYLDKRQQLLAYLIYEKTLTEVDFDQGKFGELIWLDQHVAWLYRREQWSSLTTLLSVLLWMGDTLYRAHAFIEAENCYRTLRAFATHETPCLEIIDNDETISLAVKNTFKRMTINLFVQQVDDKLGYLKTKEHFPWHAENSPPFPFPWLGDKNPLHAIRTKAKQARDIFLQQGSNSSLYQEAWTSYLTAREDYLRQLFKQVIITLGEPSCAYEVFLLGSSGRQEACTHSDIEYALGLAPHAEFAKHYNNDISRQYFDLVCQLVHMALLALGEPDQKYLGKIYNASLPKGFRADEGGNTPVDKSGLLLPISPCWPGHKNTLAGKCLRLQGDIPLERKAAIAAMEGRILPDIIIASNLLDGHSLFGNEALIDNYAKELEQALNVHCGAAAFPLREALAIALLRKCDALTTPYLLEESSASCNIKKDMLELPIYLLKTLAIYYGIHPSITNSIQRAQALTEQGYLTPTLAKALICFLRFAQALRLTAHLHYLTEEDTLYFNKQTAPSHALVLQSEHLEELRIFYQHLIMPLAQTAHIFLTRAEKEFVSKAENPFGHTDNFETIYFVMESLKSFNNLSVESMTLFLQAKAHTANQSLLHWQKLNMLIPTSARDSWPQLLALINLQYVLDKSIAALDIYHQSQHLDIQAAFYKPLVYLAQNFKLTSGVAAEYPEEIMQTLAVDSWVGKVFFSFWQAAWSANLRLQEMAAENTLSLTPAGKGLLSILESGLIRPLAARLKEMLITLQQDAGLSDLYRKLLYAVLKDYFNYQPLFSSSINREEVLAIIDFQFQVIEDFLQPSISENPSFSLTLNWQQTFTQARNNLITIRDQCYQEAKSNSAVDELLGAYISYIVQPLHQAILCSFNEEIIINSDPLLILCQELLSHFADFALPAEMYWSWQQEALNLLQASACDLPGLGKVLPMDYTTISPLSAPHKLKIVAYSAILTHADKEQHLAYYRSLPSALRLPWFVLLLKAIQELAFVEKDWESALNREALKGKQKDNEVLADIGSIAQEGALYQGATDDPLSEESDTKDFSQTILLYQDLLKTIAYEVDSTGWRLIRDLQQAVWYRQLTSLVELVTTESSTASDTVMVWMQDLEAPWDPQPKCYVLKSNVQQQLFTGLTFKRRSTTQKGNHTVLPIEIGELTFYCKLCPEQPAMESLIERLAWVVSPAGTPSAMVLKFQHGALTTAALLSAGVAGKDLEWALTQDPERVKRINQQSFMETLLRVLLTNPEDDKADDYFLVEMSDGYRLVRIDNERAYYQPDVVEDNKWMRAKRQLQVKSILYCLDQMQQLLDPQAPALQAFCAIDPLSFLQNWIADFAQLHRHYQQLFSEADIRRHFALRDADLQQHLAKDKIKESLCLLAAGLAPELLKEQLNRWTSLQTVIRLAQQQIHGSLDGVALLESVQPQLASYYRHVFRDYPVTSTASDRPLRRFDKATYGLYKVRKGTKGGYRETSTPGCKALTRSLQLKQQITLADALSIAWGEQYSPQQIRAELDKLTLLRVDDILDDLRNQRTQAVFRLSPIRQQQQIFTTLAQEAQKGQLQPEQQRFILQAMTGLPWHDLRLQPFQQVLTDDLLEALLSQAGHHLRVLQLSGQAITGTVLNLLAKVCPQLQVLVLQNLPSLTLIGEKSSDFLRRPRYEALSLPHLQVLTIRDCENLQVIQLEVPRLARLVIKECPVLRLISWENSVLTNLIQANVHNCAMLSALSLPAPWLQAARITNNPALQHLSIESQRLRELQLLGCNKLSDDVVKVLSAQSHQQLRQVSLPDTPLLQAYVQGLAAQYPSVAAESHWLARCLLALIDMHLRPIIEAVLRQRMQVRGQAQVVLELSYLIQQQPECSGFFYYRGWIYGQTGAYHKAIADWATYVYLQWKRCEAAPLMLDAEWQAMLLDIVLSSRTDAAISNLSSQAMTVLTAAKVSFSGKDLHGVRIPGAILDGGIFDGTDLQGADLSGVSLRGAFLCHANLTGCDLRGADLQTVPYLQPSIEIKQVCFSEDSQYLAATSHKHILRWKLKKLEANHALEADTLTGHTDEVTCIAFSPDGRYFASGSQDKTMQVWDKHATKKLFAADRYTQAVTSVAFSPQGARGQALLLATSNGRTVPLVDVASGNLFGMVDECRQSVTCIAFRPSSAGQAMCLLAIASGRSILLFDVINKRLTHTLDKHSAAVTSIAFSSDGHYLASGSQDKTIRLWDLQKLTEEPALLKQTSKVLCVAFHPQIEGGSSLLVSGNKDHSVRLWDIPSGREMGVINGHPSAVLSLAFSHDGRLLATGSAEHGLRLWQWQDNGYQLYWTTHPVLQARGVNITSAQLSSDNFELLEQQGAIGNRESVNLTTALSAHGLFRPVQQMLELEFINLSEFNEWARGGYLEESGVQVERKDKLTLQLRLLDHSLKAQIRKEVLNDLKKLIRASVGINHLQENTCIIKDGDALLTMRFTNKKIADAVCRLLQRHGFMVSGQVRELTLSIHNL